MNNNVNVVEKRDNKIKKMVFKDLRTIKVVRPSVANPGLKYLVR